MAAFAAVLMVAATVVSAASAISAGNAQKKAANAQAAQLEVEAGQRRATGQREGIEQRRQAGLAQSRLLSLAGASGAGAMDAGTVDITSEIEGEGEYRALTALYQTEERARGMEFQGGLSRFEGKSRQQAGYMNAAGSILYGGSKAASGFGGNSSLTIDQYRMASGYNKNYG